jgi:hypothetical protein
MRFVTALNLRSSGPGTAVNSLIANVDAIAAKFLIARLERDRARWMLVPRRIFIVTFQLITNF